MTVEYRDRVKDQSETSGTADFVIAGIAADGFRTIAAAHTNGATVRYAALRQVTYGTSITTPQWEVGEGVWTAATNTLSRVTIYASSDSGSKVTFAAGTKVVFTGPVAQDMVDATSGGGGMVWTDKKTANYTAVSGDAVPCDTTGGAFAVTLPASPSDGDNVFISTGPACSTYNLTIARNGSTLMSLSEDMTVSNNNMQFFLEFDGTTWRL